MITGTGFYQPNGSQISGEGSPRALAKDGDSSALVRCICLLCRSSVDAG